MKPWLLTCEGKETISWKMAMDVLESLGMKCSWAAAKKIVKEFDTDGDRKLDFHEFLHAMRKLRSHGVLNEMFEKYAEKNSSMSAAQLQKFFAEEQTQTISSEVAEKWIAKYSVNDQKTLCLDSFQLLMISKENELWNPEKVERKWLPALNSFSFFLFFIFKKFRSSGHDSSSERLLH
jgi:Ca2+-binding EF-hand superfamily protein